MSKINKERPRYQSADFTVDVHKDKTFEFTVYEDAESVLKVTLSYSYKFLTHKIRTKLTAIRNRPSELTYVINVNGVKETGSNYVTSDCFRKQKKRMDYYEYGDKHEFSEDLKHLKDLSPSPFKFNMVITYIRNEKDVDGASLKKAMKNLLLDQETNDISILCDTESFPCHKSILATRSDVFKAMFNDKSNFKEMKAGVLKIEDIDAHTMKVFMEYMYTDFIKRKDINCKVLMAAHKYNFKRLFGECSEHLMYSIGKENIIEIIKSAYLIESEDLFRKAVLAANKMGRKELNEDLNGLYKECPGILEKIAEYLLFDALLNESSVSPVSDSE